MFDKGQSKRIWGELYKVVDSSDVVVQVSYSVSKQEAVSSFFICPFAFGIIEDGSFLHTDGRLY